MHPTTAVIRVPPALAAAEAALLIPRCGLEFPATPSRTMPPPRSPRENDALDQLLMPAVELLRQNSVVAMPTETVYGLAASALSTDAVQRIFDAKQRPSDNPLIVHISSLDQLTPLLAEPVEEQLTPAVRAVIKTFWPGPLTLIFRRSALVPDAVSAHQPTVAVRMPAHPLASRLIELSGLPLAAPSANISGRPSPTVAEHVLADLDGRIPCVIDGGACAVGVESTVLDLQRQPPVVVRPGAITVAQLAQCMPDVRLYEAGSDRSFEAAPSTPGLKYRHYSPRAALELFAPATGAQSRCRSAVIARVSALLAEAAAAAPAPAVSVDSSSAAPSASSMASTTASSASSSSSSATPHDSAAAKAAHTASLLAVPASRAPLTSSSVIGVLLLDPCVDHDELAARLCLANAWPASRVRVLSLGPSADSAAAALFASLRRMDDLHAHTIVMEGVPEDATGVAVMNRAAKAAAVVVKVDAS